MRFRDYWGHTEGGRHSFGDKLWHMAFGKAPRLGCGHRCGLTYLAVGIPGVKETIVFVTLLTNFGIWTLMESPDFVLNFPGVTQTSQFLW